MKTSVEGDEDVENHSGTNDETKSRTTGGGVEKMILDKCHFG